MVEVLNQIVVPGHPALEAGLAVAPFGQVHLHSTGNDKDSLSGEKNYLANNYPAANYTNLVGWNPATNRAEAWQVMATNGGAYDVGGDWNWEGYASIEFAEGSITNQDQFKATYGVYIALAVQLGREAGISDLSLDNSNIKGIKTHNYASATGHGSDHVDPLPFLQKWGVSYQQLKNDIANGAASEPGNTTAPHPAPDNGGAGVKVGSHVQPRWREDEGLGKLFIADAVTTVNKIDQLAEYDMAGGSAGFTWSENGIPTDVVDEYNSDGTAKTGDQVMQTGSYFRFNVYFTVTKQGTDESNGKSYSYIVPDGYADDYGFWVLTEYLD